MLAYELDNEEGLQGYIFGTYNVDTSVSINPNDPFGNTHSRMPISHDQIVRDEELDQRVDLTANFGQRVCVKQAELHLRLYAEYIELYQKDFGENAVFDWDRCIKTCNQVLGNRMKASKGGVTHHNGDYQSKMKFQTLRVLRNAMVIVSSI